MTGPLGPNEALIGQPGSRRRLSTPALLVELDAFEHNLAGMAALAAAAGKRLRPHGKAHKSSVVARRQIEAGAIGVCCVTLGEAEMLVDAAIPGILVTSPVVGAGPADRLAALNARSGDMITVVADSPEAVDALDAAAGRAGAPLGMLVDADVGQRRTGVTDASAGVDLAGRIAGAPNLRYRGVQAYYGHLQHIAAYADRRQAALSQIARLEALIGRLAAAGLAPEIVTGGGTGTARIDLDDGPFTEIQPGSYLFLDAQYGAVELAPGGGDGSGRGDGGSSGGLVPSLFVQAQVVGANQPDRAVINAGVKAFATEAGPPRFVDGAPEGSAFQFMGDEHAALVYPPGANARLRPGDVVVCVPPHCDPTVNLYARFHVVRGDRLVDIWPIDAGRF